MSSYLCGLCNPLLYFCHLTVPLASYCPGNVAQNPLQPTGLKKYLFYLVLCADWLGVGWSSRFGWAWIQVVGGFQVCSTCLSSSDQLVVRVCSFPSLGQGTSRRPCHASTFQASTYLMSASVPLTKASHSTELKLKRVPFTHNKAIAEV